jgi:adenine-specific DNA-methyltransferase
VIQRLEKGAEGKLDLETDGKPRCKEGFRVFKLAPSNFKVWDAHTDGGIKALEHQLELAVHNIHQDRAPEDLLYEILIKSEFPLTALVTNFDAAGIEAFSVQQDNMIVCVAREVTEAAITAIAARKPLQVVFLDEAFSGNDQLKKNARLNFEAAGVTRFQTI